MKTFTLTIALLASQALFAKVVAKDEKIAGTMLHYKVALPDDYDAAKEYPAIIAFPGGGQTLPMVDGILARNYAAQAAKRGYIVAALSAPTEGLFFEGGAKVFPAFLEKMLVDYKIRGRKFHIAGISNGGLSAFHIAASYPKYFLSVTGFPGYLIDPTPQRVNALKGMCLYMYAGERDTGWAGDEQEQSASFRTKGMKVKFSIEKGQGHVMTTLEGAGAARLFENFEEAERGCAN